MTTIINDERIIIKEKVLDFFKDGNIINNITPKNIFTIITTTMAIIDKNVIGAAGVEKKQLCLNVIYDIIASSPINDETKDYISGIVTTIFDPFVENIIDATKGRFDINKGKKLLDFICKCSGPLFKKIKK